METVMSDASLCFLRVAPCVQEVRGHTTLLLTSLNLQREKAQFCDCVVRQRQSPGQLYPAHRCVLAASSPVLASVLSSTGALVELQDPCLSGSVLAVLLDYIYTGALPCACSQQQYKSLLTAARYLQMNKLQEALCAWQQAELNNPDETDTWTGTESQAHKNIISTRREAADTFNECLLSTSSTDARRRVDETDTCSVQSTASSLEGTNVGKYVETQVRSESINTYIEEAKTDTCGAHSTTGAGILYERSGIADDCSEVIHLTPQAVIQNIPGTSRGYSVSTVDKDTEKLQVHIGTVKPETWQRSTEEELVRTVEVGRSSSSSPSPLQHPCSVPVICHSSRAAMLQLAEVSTSPFYRPAIRTSGDFSRVSTSQSAITENESTVKDITTEHRNHHGTENLDYGNKKENSEAQSSDSSDECDTQESCYRSTTTQSDPLVQDYAFSSNHANPAGDHNENQTKHFVDESVPRSVCRRFISGSKHKNDVSLDDLPSKHQHLDLSDHDVSMSDAVKEDPQHLETGSDSRCENFCSEGEVKEEHSCSSKYPSEINKHGHHSDVYGPRSDWNPGLGEADTSTKCATSIHREYDSDNRNTSMEDERRSADVCPHVSNTPESNFDVSGSPSAFEHHTFLDTSEPHFTSTVPESMYSPVWPSYQGHVRYHCLSQEETHSSHIGSNGKHSRPRDPDCSDQSSDDEACGTFASSGQSPMRQHFDTGTPEQVLLLDISTKHAELLVSYKHSADQERKALDKKDTLGAENNDKEQRNEATSEARTKIRDRTKLRAETSEPRNKLWVRETNIEERQFVDREQSRLGPEVKNKARAVDVSKREVGANQTGTLTSRSAPTVPESVQASVSSTLSVCIPSGLPASTSTNISAHLSTPVNQAFQCSLCDRSFSQRGSLNRHVRSHLGVRPFPCPCCPMTFSRQYRVTEHMRVHQRCTLGNDLTKPPATSIGHK
ncbi:hypothetical protein Q5P01_006890 [Channa striata]|uniref:Uncharacterized protein n=1 Tax=Channa striata TaxID=64152 RepID=A0AA88NF23_CHASR|nr:hypothetical protein Q5P01_006890 [Channa striata]